MRKLVFLLFLFSTFSFSETIRKPSFAGSFYPANKRVLSKMIDGFLKNVKEENINKNKIIGVIAPHAGYIYSGQTAAYSFKLLEGMKNKTFIILGKSHHAYFKEAIIDDRDIWLTPLGKVKIDRGLFKEFYRKTFI